MKYWLDGHDRITGTGAEWDAFAIANGAPSLLRNDVVGHDIWRYVADPSTRQLWELLFGKAREKGHVHVRIRCDAPALRRDLLVQVRSDPHGALEITTEELLLEPRPPQALLDAAVERSSSFLKICSWCKNIDVSGRWVDVEEASGLLGLLQSQGLPNLTHGICPSCHEKIMATLTERATR